MIALQQAVLGAQGKPVRLDRSASKERGESLKRDDPNRLSVGEVRQSPLNSLQGVATEHQGPGVGQTQPRTVPHHIVRQLSQPAQ